MAKNRTCKVCGIKYSYCPTCYEDKYKPTWMMLYHDDNCRQIWATVSAALSGDMPKDEAVKKLRSLDLTNLESFVPQIRDQIKELLKEQKAPVKAKKVEEE